MQELATRDNSFANVSRAEDQAAVRRPGKGYLAAKRCFDVVMSLLALILLSPLFLVLAVIIFVDDPHGSPIFSQIRVGKDGRLFRFYKFRSMIVNAEDLLEKLQDQNEMEGPAFKIKDDPRITRVGKFIRRTSLDELPQLVNVLKGELSLVGPRPPLPREVEQYTPRQIKRLTVKPGLTCYWQTQPHRNSLSFDQWLALDLRYINERSALVDLKILFATVKVVLRGDGI